MANSENSQYLKEFIAYSKEINSSKEKAHQFYIRAGILTPDGKLTKNYKPTDKVVYSTKKRAKI
jgi:hypothetical protein